MRNIYLRLLLLIFLSAIAIETKGQSEKEIVAYYPNWQWYDRAQLINPESIQYEKYTVINYAFFRPLADGSLQSTDSWADENLLLGPMIWWPVQTHDSTKSLPYLCQQHGVKLLPSIGGWNDSYNFPGIAADPVKRQTFISDCLGLIAEYDFNGVDLDWEYPGYAPHGGSPADKENFTLLVQELREALDDLSVQTGDDYLLTSCFGASEERMQYIEWENIVPLVDMINLMTYDFHGSWDPESNHHTPLYSPAVGNPDWCFHGAFTKLTQEFGVPPQKINMGVAFYGKALANCTELYGSHTGYDASTFWEDEGQPLYYNIMKNMDLFVHHWDDQVKCPYLLGNSINTFVTYDDPLSVAHKAQYVMDHDAKGVIIWELTGDYLETYPGSGQIAGTPLLDTIHQVFDQLTQTIIIPDGWSGISTWLSPQNPVVADIFENMVQNDDLIVFQNHSFMYWPGQGINTIDASGGWDYQSGYQIKVDGDQQITIAGNSPASKTLTYESPGWYLIPVLNACGVAPETLFSGMIDDLEIIKEVAGLRLFWPGVFQNLFELEPGKSYAARFADAASFTFPECNKTVSAENNDSQGFEMQLLDMKATRASHIIAFEPGATGLLKPGDRIRITAGQEFEFAEVVIHEPGIPVAIPVFADDQSTRQKDGFRPNEKPDIRILRGDRCMEATAVFDEKFDGPNLKINGMSLVNSLKFNNEELDGNIGVSISFYPNPSHDILYFRGVEDGTRVKISTIAGTLILNRPINNQRLEIPDLTRGVYFLHIYQGNHSFVKKIVKQ